jgi:hypothetical protein
MSEFKPMVKMYTDEPSVSLKLKKGGKVKAKHHKEHEEHGHKAMHHHAMGGMHHAFESEHGKAPKKPSMMERMKAMNPNQYKKGGKVAHKVMGGGMPMANPAMGGMAPMGPKAISAMDPMQRNARKMMVRKALTGMKKGGSADHKMIEKLEKELHHHESLPMSKAHHKASGGAIDRDETRTTIEKGAKKFAKTMVVDGEHKDRAHGTGMIKEGRPGGYAHGGKVHRISGHPEGTHEHHKAMAKHHKKMCDETGSAHHARKCEEHKHMAKMCKGGSYAKGGTTGERTPADTHESYNKGKIMFGGTIEDNEHDYENTQMHSAKRDKAHGTGGVSMSNAGGFKHGGKAHHKMHHKATGGAIPAASQKNMKEGHFKHDTVEGGDWENRAADTATAGVKNTRTGEVKESNAGGYRHGGHASKKHYATGGNVVDDGKAVKMPKHFVSRPVANSLQSGTFKTGGNVKKLAKGGRAEKEEKPNLRLISTHTGPKGHVAKVYKDKDWGEHRVRFYSPEGKHYPESDYHTDDKEDAHDTAKFALNRYKHGGKAKHFAQGDSVIDDAGTRATNKAYENFQRIQKEENEADANMIPNAIKSGMKAVKGMFGSKSPESVTKTEKSITVTPAKKRGGSMKR